MVKSGFFRLVAKNGNKIRDQIKNDDVETDDLDFSENSLISRCHPNNNMMENSLGLFADQFERKKKDFSSLNFEKKEKKTAPDSIVFSKSPGGPDVEK